MSLDLPSLSVRPGPATDFFDRQDAARRKTKLFVFYFVVAVILIVGIVYLVCDLIFARPRTGVHSLADLWNLQVFLTSTLATLTLIAIGSAFKIWELRSGGAALVTSLGGRPLNPGTTDPDEQKLRNIVEEMAVASGTRVPQIFILDDEDGINAFAAGHSPEDAAIGVTRGAIQLLNRDELQGVIAHEFSHILNGDMRLNLRLMGLINGILLLALLGQGILRVVSSVRDDSSGLGGVGKKKEGIGVIGAIVILSAALFVIGYIGVFFARLIKSAISRQREFLADAAAVEFTRNPGGLAGALKKIGGLPKGSRLDAECAEEASHMFFGNGLRNPWFGWMETHPPLVERIKVIEPDFDGAFPRVLSLKSDRLAHEASVSYTKRGSPVAASLIPWNDGGSVRPTVRAAVTMDFAGAPSPVHLDYAAQFHGTLPDGIQAAAHEPFGATALLYALLLSGDEPMREAQMQLLEQGAEPGILEEVRQLQPAVLQLDPKAKLPVVDLALPALRLLARDQFQSFRANLQHLIDCDHAIDLFEFTLLKIVVRNLEPLFEKQPRPVVQVYSIRGVLDQVSLLLSALAHIGATDAKAKQAAFAIGVKSLQAPDVAPTLLPIDKCGLTDIDMALNKINQCAPQIKRNVLSACAHTVAADGVVQVSEAELLRAIAAALDCPLPPFLEQGLSNQAVQASSGA